MESPAPYRVSDLKDTVSGTGLLKQGLIRLLVERARERAKKDYTYCKDFECLHDPMEQWRHGQYRSIATILDVSTNTVKRLFGCNGYTKEQQNLSPQTRQKIQTFLETDDWEKETLLHILRKGLTK